MTVLILALWVAIVSIQPDTLSNLPSTCGCPGYASDISPEEMRKLIRKEFDAASIVFSGEIIELDTFEVKFKIEKIWKGTSEDEIKLLTGAKKIDENTVSHSSCDYYFWKDRKYLVYAFGSLEALKTHACSRTGEAKYSERDIEELNRIKPPVVRGRSNR